MEIVTFEDVHFEGKIPTKNHGLHLVNHELSWKSPLLFRLFLFDISLYHTMPFTRCVRCAKFYETSPSSSTLNPTDLPEELQCWFHPGRYTDPDLIRNGILVGWSCCRSDGVDGNDGVLKEALKRDGKGCVFSGVHEEDYELTEMILMAQVGGEGKRVCVNV